MNPEHLMTMEATITSVAQSATPDEYGDPTYDDADTTVACWLHQVARNEQGDNNNTQGEAWAIYLPPDTVIDGGDRVTVDGDSYEVDGPPWRANNPRMRKVTHIEANLKRVV